MIIEYGGEPQCDNNIIGDFAAHIADSLMGLDGDSDIESILDCSIMIDTENWSYTISKSPNKYMSIANILKSAGVDLHEEYIEYEEFAYIMQRYLYDNMDDVYFTCEIED